MPGLRVVPSGGTDEEQIQVDSRQALCIEAGFRGVHALVFGTTGSLLVATGLKHLYLPRIFGPDLLAGASALQFAEIRT